MRTLLIAASVLALGPVMEAQADPRGGMSGAPRPGMNGGGRPGGWNGGGMKPGGWNGGSGRPTGWNGGGARPSRWIGGSVKPGGWNGGGHVVRPGFKQPRWGGHIQGRWWGGMRAPGGWGAYRQPVRGWALPSYWVQPNWYITDWSSYGLSQPPYGYTWSRYYDDAVLIDGRGSVYDRVGGIGWDRMDGEGADYGYYEDGYDTGGYDNGGYDNGYSPAPQLPYPGQDADGGLGGAIIGGVVGGVAGNVIAGRGNRLGGTLIGAGAGALVGQAIDKSDRAGREYRPAQGYPAPGYGAPYPTPQNGRIVQGHGAAPQVAYQTGSYGGDYAGTTYSGVTHYGPAPVPQPGGYPRAPYPGGPASVVTQNGATVTSTTMGGSGYVAGGFYYPGATITTVTVSQAGSAAAYEEVYQTESRFTKGSTRRAAGKGHCNC